MYTDEQLEKLEQEELALTEEHLLAIAIVIANAHDSITQALRDFYQKYGKDGVVTYAEARKWVNDQDRRRRWTTLSALIALEFDNTLDSSKGLFNTMLASIVGKESTFFDVEVDVDKLLDKPWGNDDLTWLQRLENDVDLWNVQIASDIKRAMLQQKNLDEVLEMLEKRFGSIQKVMKKLGLTESTATGSLTRQQIFKELGITQYRFYTKADERTCEVCGAMHGMIFPMAAYEVGVTASPLHPRCRCFETPITE